VSKVALWTSQFGWSLFDSLSEFHPRRTDNEDPNSSLVEPFCAVLKSHDAGIRCCRNSRIPDGDLRHGAIITPDAAPVGACSVTVGLPDSKLRADKRRSDGVSTDGKSLLC